MTWGDQVSVNKAHSFIFNIARLLATPSTAAYQAPPSMGFSRQEYRRGLPFPPPGNLPNPGSEPASPASSALAGRFITTEPPGKPFLSIALPQKKKNKKNQKTHTHTHTQKTYEGKLLPSSLLDVKFAILKILFRHPLSQKEDWLLENRQWYKLGCIQKQALLVNRDKQNLFL